MDRAASISSFRMIQSMSTTHNRPPAVANANQDLIHHARNSIPSSRTSARRDAQLSYEYINTSPTGSSNSPDTVTPRGTDDGVTLYGTQPIIRVQHLRSLGGRREHGFTALYVALFDRNQLNFIKFFQLIGFNDIYSYITSTKSIATSLMKLCRCACGDTS